MAELFFYDHQLTEFQTNRSIIILSFGYSIYMVYIQQLYSVYKSHITETQLKWMR
jgi:hypothetical protein